MKKVEFNLEYKNLFLFNITSFYCSITAKSPILIRKFEKLTFFVNIDTLFFTNIYLFFILIY